LKHLTKRIGTCGRFQGHGVRKLVKVGKKSNQIFIFNVLLTLQRDISIQ